MTASFVIGGKLTNRVTERKRGIVDSVAVVLARTYAPSSCLPGLRRDPYPADSGAFVRVLVSMSEKERDLLRARAVEAGLEFSTFVRRAIEAYRP